MCTDKNNNYYYDNRHSIYSCDVPLLKAAQNDIMRIYNSIIRCIYYNIYSCPQNVAVFITVSGVITTVR